MLQRMQVAASSGARTGMGELRMIHSRVAWMFCPVDRSISVSAPHMVLHCSFSTSCHRHVSHINVCCVCVCVCVCVRAR